MPSASVGEISAVRLSSLPRQLALAVSDQQTWQMSDMPSQDLQMGQVFLTLFPSPGPQAGLAQQCGSLLPRFLLHPWLGGKLRHKRSQPLRDWNLFLTSV